MWLTHSFLSLFLEGGGEQCAYILTHKQLPYMVINVQGGGPNIGWKILKVWEIFKFVIRVAGRIGSHIESLDWQRS